MEGPQKQGQMKPGSWSLRPTIGFLTHALADAYGALLWAGVMDAAREGDANLLCYPGQVLDDSDGFEAQANVLYNLVSAENVDGLVLSGGVLSNFVGVDGLNKFCERYRPLPMASIAVALDGIPSVLVENYRGMREVMTHLIEVHGLRRIAFISGPRGNVEAEMRYQAYVDGLTEVGLPLIPALVSPPILWDDVSGGAAMRLLLDERGLLPRADFEAVVTSSDNSAFGVLVELQARGVYVPDDVVVTGFDAQERSEFLIPPLTTVRQPLYEQARLATEMVLAQLRGQAVPEQVTLPTELVVRQSCGCLDRVVVQAAVGAMAHPLTGTATGGTVGGALSARRERILAEMMQAVETASDGIAPRWPGRLLEAFSAEVEGQSPGVFLLELDKTLRQVVAIGGEVSVWQEVLSVLRCRALPCLIEEGAFRRAEDLWQQARVMIGEMAERVRVYRQLQAEQRTEILRETGQALTTTFEMAKLLDVAAQELPRLGIPRCYLSLYEGQEMPPARSKLIMAYDEKGRVELEPEGRRFPTCQLAPEGLLPRTRRYVMVVEPLYFGEHQIGLALFEVGPQQGSVYETLQGQMSSALKGALLMQEREQAEKALEEAYAEVEQQVEERTAALQREILERERLQQEVITAQKVALQELSTPIIPVMEQVIVMPLIGSIDTLRARDITRALLGGIREYQAKVVILDITGVPLVDSGVAVCLNKTIQAARLKGAQTIITGISDAVAETIVDLGIDWSGIETLSDLQTGLRVALARMGQYIVGPIGQAQAS